MSVRKDRRGGKKLVYPEGYNVGGGVRHFSRDKKEKRGIRNVRRRGKKWGRVRRGGGFQEKEKITRGIGKNPHNITGTTEEKKQENKTKRHGNFVPKTQKKKKKKKKNKGKPLLWQGVKTETTILSGPATVRKREISSREIGGTIGVRKGGKAIQKKKKND